MRRLALLILLFTTTLKAQVDSTFVDNKYLEDQLYFSLTYIHMLNLPDEISQSGFSYGLAGGFIKDFPLNQRRNIGLGVGIGYSFNNYYFNVNVSTDEPADEAVSIRNNKVILHSVELPIEFRFRTSTAKKYKFWRIYPGFKMAYKFAQNTSFGKSNDFDVDDIIDINDFLYGLTFSVGYNKWNIHTYYGLNDLFTEAKNVDHTINISDFRIGLIFYIF
jgi:hypothetical protein